MQIRTKARSPILRLIAISLLWSLSRSQAAQPAVLDIGARAADCTSALRLGLQSCEAPTDAQTRGPTAGYDRNTLEARVDAYLANFGKPPRAAVRALLEPSDENIQAFVTDQKNTLSLAAYVAARMTALKDRLAPGADAATGQNPALRFQLQAFGQARLRLFQKPGETSTASLMQAMAELAQVMPGLQVGVQIVGPLDPAQLKREISRIDPQLSVEVTSPGQVPDQALPFLRLDDIERGTSRDFEANPRSAMQLGRALLSSRQARQGHSDAAAPEGTP